MNKVIITACVLLITGAISVDASALYPVQLRPDCAYVFNPYNGNPPGLDGQAEQIIIILQMTGMSLLVSDWQEADLETVNGEIVGDGIPDNYQLAVLGAALCAGDPEIASEYAHNRAEFTALLQAVGSVSSTAVTFTGEAAPIADDLSAWAGTLPDGPLKTEALYLVDMLEWTVDRLSQNVVPYASMATGVLPAYAPFFASFAALNSGTRATIDDLLSMIIDYLTSYCTVGVLHSEIDLLGELAQPPMSPELAARCLILRETIASAIPLVEGLHLPNWVVYGSARKASNEPLAADGDYNGDGLTNARVYELVTAAGGDRFDFVRAAASNDPFWSGNPGLPATGLFGLLVMVLGVGIAGFRRNSG